MCEDYIAAGLPPARFWEITPRLYLAEMAGAAGRMRRERGAVWDAAVMAREGAKVPKRADYIGPSPRAPKYDIEAQAKAWVSWVQAKQAAAR